MQQYLGSQRRSMQLSPVHPASHRQASFSQRPCNPQLREQAPVGNVVSAKPQQHKNMFYEKKLPTKTRVPIEKKMVPKLAKILGIYCVTSFLYSALPERSFKIIIKKYCDIYQHFKYEYII